MGVYIKGMDMPMSCGECRDSGLWSVVSHLCKGGCFEDYYGCCAIGQAGCPFVEVEAPHGDLIDRDALPYTTWYIENSPAVIEAEGNNDD